MNRVDSDRRTRAFAPISSGNVIVGFDVLGLAIRPTSEPPWGDIVEVRDRDDDRESDRGGDATLRRDENVFDLHVTGLHADDLPSDPRDNLVFAVAEAFFMRCATRRDADGDVSHAIDIILEKRLPVCSGLGSSASSAVAAALALNEHFDRLLTADEVLDVAAVGESHASGSIHLDNVAPSLLGGLVLLGDGPSGRTLTLPWPSSWRLALALPDVSVPTKLARDVLPTRVSLSDTIGFGRRLAQFLTGVQGANAELVRDCLRDELVEPHRSRLVPGFDQARQAARETGALGSGFSGSGPTTMALTEDEATAQAALAAMVEVYRNEGLACRGIVATVDEVGARVIEDEP